jgi:hypothetical protein
MDAAGGLQEDFPRFGLVSCFGRHSLPWYRKSLLEFSFIISRIYSMAFDGTRPDTCGGSILRALCTFQIHPIHNM